MSSCFFFKDTATTAIYTLSLHDALPIFPVIAAARLLLSNFSSSSLSSQFSPPSCCRPSPPRARRRSEEHTSELQSLTNLVCRLLLEKNNIIVQNLVPFTSGRLCVHLRGC